MKESTDEHAHLQRHLHELETNGFTILRNVITPAECDEYRGMLEAAYQQYSALYANQRSSSVLADKSGERVVFNLHNKNLAWYKLFEHQAVTSLLDVILNEGSYGNERSYYLYNNPVHQIKVPNPGQVCWLHNRKIHAFTPSTILTDASNTLLQPT